MANDFYTPEQVARVSVNMLAQDAYLSALVNRNFEDDLLGGGGKGRTVNVKVPTALVAHARGIDDVTNAIILDSISETTVPVTLGVHAYNAVGLSEGDLSLDLANFSEQVLAPQTEAVTEFIEETVAAALRSVAMDTSIAFDEAAPEKTFTQIRKVLRERGLPMNGLNVAVGTDVYAALLDAKAIVDASQSGSTDALREGNVGKVRGLTVVESTRIDSAEIVAWHRDALTLAVRAPLAPAGASFAAKVAEKGFQMRYLRDYDARYTQDRSIVSTFVGAAKIPFYKVERTTDLTKQGDGGFTAGSATVTPVADGGFFRMSIADAEPV